jgi:hypothetical protein
VSENRPPVVIGRHASGVPRVGEPRRLGDVRDIHLTDACSAGLVFALIIRSVT